MKNYKLKMSKLPYQIKKILYIRKNIRTTEKFKKLYIFSKSITSKKLILKEEKLELLNNISSFRLLK